MEGGREGGREKCVGEREEIGEREEADFMGPPLRSVAADQIADRRTTIASNSAAAAAAAAPTDGRTDACFGKV